MTVFILSLKSSDDKSVVRYFIDTPKGDSYLLNPDTYVTYAVEKLKSLGVKVNLSWLTFPKNTPIMNGKEYAFIHIKFKNKNICGDVKLSDNGCTVMYNYIDELSIFARIISLFASVVITSRGGQDITNNVFSKIPNIPVDSIFSFTHDYLGFGYYALDVVKTKIGFSNVTINFNYSIEYFTIDENREFFTRHDEQISKFGLDNGTIKKYMNEITSKSENKTLSEIRSSRVIEDLKLIQKKYLGSLGENIRNKDFFLSYKYPIKNVNYKNNAFGERYVITNKEIREAVLVYINVNKYTEYNFIIFVGENEADYVASVISELQLKNCRLSVQKNRDVINSLIESNDFPTISKGFFGIFSRSDEREIKFLPAVETENKNIVVEDTVVRTEEYNKCFVSGFSGENLRNLVSLEIKMNDSDIVLAMRNADRITGFKKQDHVFFVIRDNQILSTILCVLKLYCNVFRLNVNNYIEGISLKKGDKIGNITIDDSYLLDVERNIVSV